MTKKQITKSEFQELSKVMDKLDILKEYEIEGESTPIPTKPILLDQAKTINLQSFQSLISRINLSQLNAKTIIAIAIIVSVLISGVWYINNESELSRYETIPSELYQNGIMKVKKNNKLAVINESKKLINTDTYDQVDFSGDIIIVKKDGKFNYFKKNGQYLSKIWYDNMKLADKNNYGYVAEFSSDKKSTGYLHKTGALFGSIGRTSLGDGITVFSKYESNDSKLGLIKSDGTIIVDPKFSRIETLDTGFAVVNLKNGDSKTYDSGLYGIIRPDGSYLLEPKYYLITGGDYKSDSYYYNFFDNGLADVEITNNSGRKIVKKDGTFVSDIAFKIISRQSTKDKNVIDAALVNTKNDKSGIIAKNGNWIVEPKYDNISSFDEGIAQTTLNGKKGFIRSDGSVVVEPKYDWISNPAKGDTFQVKLNNKYGCIKSDGSVLIEPIVDYSMFIDCNDSGFVRVGDGGALYNYTHIKSGKKFNYKSIDKFGGHIVASDVTFSNERFSGGRWGVLDPNGDWYIDQIYDYIYYDEKTGIFGVTLNGRRGKVDLSTRKIIWDN